MVPPSFLSAQYVDAFALGIPDAPARLNGGNSCRWLADARVGDRLERRSEIVGADSKAGRTGRLDVYQIETRYRRLESGAPVAVLGYTAIRRYPSTGSTGPARRSPTATSGGHDSRTLPRTATRALTVLATPRQVVSYAVATDDLYEAHYDAGAAMAAGLPGTILHGLLKLAWFARAALEHAGDGSVVREIEARYHGLDRVADEFSVWVAAPDDAEDGRLQLFGGHAEDAITTTGTVVLDQPMDDRVARARLSQPTMPRDGTNGELS